MLGKVQTTWRGLKGRDVTLGWGGERLRETEREEEEEREEGEEEEEEGKEQGE